MTLKTSFIDRFARFVQNILHINRLHFRVEVNEEHLNALARTAQQRLDKLENIVNTIPQRLDTLESIADALQRRVEILETTVPPVIAKEIHYQVDAFQKRINQERLFIAPPIRRPRLAYVSPLPPEQSGISDYSAELLPVLSRYYDVEAIVAQPSVSDSWISAYCPVRSVEWFQQHAADYERVLYQFGNSPFHSHMFELLQQHPGVVVLHDFFLGSVLAYEETSGAMPGIWTNALYDSHGYLAVKESFGANGMEHAKNTYPCNLAVLQHARSVIVHSEYSRKLACQWYGAHAADNWSVIPHLRTPVASLDRLAARRDLGIDEDAFVVGSFGFVDPVKLSHRILEAWLASHLRTDLNSRLVLVGANHPGDYGAQLSERIRNSGCQDRIRITGWVDDKVYKQYLQAADVAVQLRSISRGETSGAILHCLNFGLPTIVNANGSTAELPQDVVWKLPDAFDDTELTTALSALWENRTKRAELGSKAMQFIRTGHNPAHCANQYAEAMEAAYAKADADDAPEPSRLPAGVSASAGKLMPRQLLVDISTIVHNDLRTGIERVVRAQLFELLHKSLPGFRVEPVYLSTEGGIWHYRYAREYTKKLLSIDSATLKDTAVHVAASDVFYSPDFYPAGVVAAAKGGLYADWRARGVEINFLIHDILPILRPDFFPDRADQLHAQWLDCIAKNADRLICISNAVANEVLLWLKQQGRANADQLKIAVLHHGANIEASMPSSGMPDDAAQLLGQISSMPSFLMVGTIEPRKGHLQTLAAFEQLWEEGKQVNLVIVGKEGWKLLQQDQRRTIPEIVDRLHHHPELGKRLFWLQEASDEYLRQIYSACVCLVFASEGEGFGLPLIEAAQHELPIVARDIPVFREIAQQNAFYFDGLSADALASAVQHWLELNAEGKAPASIAIQSRTWAQNATELIAVLEGQQPELI